MNTIGFIGLGTMGGPMATNLLKKGYAVTVYNRTPKKAAALERLGAKVAASPAEAARSADVIITMVSDDDAVKDVYYADEGIVSALKPGQACLDCSTISPELSIRIHEQLSAREVDFFDAPVTGSEPAAIAGKLVFMVGGDGERLARYRDILLAMGSEYLHMGPAGSGSRAKLAINTIAAVNMAALVEGMTVAAKSGIDPESFLRLTQAGGSASRIAELKRDKLLDGDYSPQFTMQLMAKDLRLAVSQAAALSVPSPLLHAAETLYRLGVDKGLGHLDLAAIASMYEEWADASLTRARPDQPSTGGAAGGAAGTSERRRSFRVPLNIQLHVSIHQWEKEGAFSGQSVKATLLDLSEDGIKIASDLPLAMDMFVVIHFPKEAQLPPITGKIIRIDHKDDTFHYGCLISGLAPHTRIQLEAYIRSHLEERFASGSGEKRL